MLETKYTAFNETRLVPLKVYINRKRAHYIFSWDTTLWLERPEDWYSLMSPDLKDKRVRVIERKDWLRGEKCEQEETVRV